MRILILGAGKMGSFFTDVLSFDHEVAVFDVNPKKLRFMYNCCRFTNTQEIEEFKPELVINAATVKYTLDAFNQVLPKNFTKIVDSAMYLLTRCLVLRLPTLTS